MKQEIQKIRSANNGRGVVYGVTLIRELLYLCVIDDSHAENLPYSLPASLKFSEPR